MLASLHLQNSEINWKKYPPDVVAFHDHWHTAQTHDTYGWDQLVDPAELLMVAVISKLSQLLVFQLRTKIHEST